MKTIKQIKQIVENIAESISSLPNGSKGEQQECIKAIGKDFSGVIGAVRDYYIPLTQFNIEFSSTEDAQAVFQKIAENVHRKVSVAYLPDGQHTIDEVEGLKIETPTIMEWQNGELGQNFVINYTNGTVSQAQNLMNQLVVDMLLSLPGNSFKIHFVDLALSGQAAFLTRNLDSNIYGKLISNNAEWQQLQNTLREKMVKSLEEYGDVVKYNESKGRVEIPYDVVVITNYRSSLKNMQDLDPLFENGHKGGIYFILMNNQGLKNDGDIDSIMAMTSSYQALDASSYGQYDKEAFIRCTPILDNPILAKACFNYINKGAETPQIEAASVDHDKLLSGSFEPIDKAMTIPVGTTEKGDLVDFTLDTVSHIHCFIIGQSGTGKSVFLHDVIIGAMSKYSPDELELYLMDFKIGGVEFNRYKDEKHVKALLVDNSDVQITLEILRDISNRMRERGRLLRASGVSNIVEYNQKNPTKKMPRIVFIADECHVMFPNSTNKEMRLYREIADILAKIAKEGRSQGVHLILATQTIAQSEIPSEVINNISDFYLLKCSTADSDHLVENSSKITGQLKTGQVLHHDIDNNVVFKSTYLPTSEALKVIEKINAKTKGFKGEQFYFVGSQIFQIDDEVKSLLKQKDTAIALGRSIDTQMQPVVIQLRNEYADNVILFGINDEEQVSRTTMATMKSLRLSNKSVKIKVINCLSEEQQTTNRLLKDLAGKGEIELLNPASCGEELQGIAKSIKNRDAEQTVLYILGQERFRELRMNMEIKSAPDMDDFSFSSSFSNSSNGDADFSSYQKVIEYILKNGAEVGVHVVLQIDKPSQLLFDDYMTGKTFFSMFHHVVMLRSDSSAVNSLGMSDELKLENLSSDIERLRATYYNEANNSYTLFTPFDF